MNVKPPIGTYRVQLRNGVDFAELVQQLDYFMGLGISHLYLSPIFTAVTGSTHGYDIVDPNEIDPVLGGRAGFEALAVTAKAKGIGIILDVVPNHTSFSLENRWLTDVLRKGQQSIYAPAFDIDWSAGPLVLPFLPDPFAAMLDAGAFSISDGYWRFGDLSVPLADTNIESSDLNAVHAAQHWQLVHWELERDGITHRRFFNVTGLIGMRVEDQAVFDRTHQLIFDLADAGHVDGLRVDHIDGLADPEQYLKRLEERLPGTPVWIEKILVGNEKVPSEWKTAGTTGYEAARWIAQVLTDTIGLERIDKAWRDMTGITQSFPEALEQAKIDILDNELAAERLQLVALAKQAALASPQAEPGDEALREAVTLLLGGMSRYRTYVVDEANSSDAALIDAIVLAAQPKLRSRKVIDLLAEIIKAPRTDAERRFVIRFQQVSGALLAKAQEDTVGFRWTRYIAANEVGAEPDEATIEQTEANRFLELRDSWDMTLTSTHDTKRSEDSRMRLVAMSHLPGDFIALAADAHRLKGAAAITAAWRWYLVQSVLAIWDEETAAIFDRLDQHVEKAMREAKTESFWTHPNLDLEADAKAFAAALVRDWRERQPDELYRLINRGEALSFAQLAIKMIMPGFPDIYRGGEQMFFALTDPDNRLPIDRDDMSARFGDEKLRWTRELLTLRRDHAELFDGARAELSRSGGLTTLKRYAGGKSLTVEFGENHDIRPGEILAHYTNDHSWSVVVR